MANSRINRGEADILTQARSVIRDLAYGYPPKELVQTPERMCEQLSHILQEKYDFEKGEIVEESHSPARIYDFTTASGARVPFVGVYLRQADGEQDDDEREVLVMETSPAWTLGEVEDLAVRVCQVLNKTRPEDAQAVREVQTLNEGRKP